ncbi:hypothetical protein FDUTEX481_07928 [Tolypothrix sp. PCC 7601]|nr:hypothetical protein FDUTEX481_07928 [Tolypothrix sp. PCC 7601]BAY90720.1 hypothetical protein NIES3275_27370 [Microchaete diplosiphon NIES-3275]
MCCRAAQRTKLSTIKGALAYGVTHPTNIKINVVNKIKIDKLMTTSVNTAKVYDEIIDFIAAGTTPQSVVNFQLSDLAKGRLEELIYRHKTGELTQEDKRELNHFLTLEHIMTLAKAKAHQYLSAE